MALKTEIPARNASFLDRDRTSRGIFPKGTQAQLAQCKIAPRMALKTVIPQETQVSWTATGGRAGFSRKQKNEKTAFGIFPKAEKYKKRLSGFSRRQKNEKPPFGLFPKGEFKISLRDFPERYTSSMTLCKIAPRMALKTEIPARNAQHFLDRDRRSRGIFPKGKLKNDFRAFPENLHII